LKISPFLYTSRTPKPNNETKKTTKHIKPISTLHHILTTGFTSSFLTAHTHLGYRRNLTVKPDCISRNKNDCVTLKITSVLRKQSKLVTHTATHILYIYIKPNHIYLNRKQLIFVREFAKNNTSNHLFNQKPEKKPEVK